MGVSLAEAVIWLVNNGERLFNGRASSGNFPIRLVQPRRESNVRNEATSDPSRRTDQ
jgi:hypothetical protein